MSISRKELEERRAKIKELYEQGVDLFDIAEATEVNLQTVYNALSIAGITLRKSREIDESNLVHADNSVVLEKVVIGGKIYTDITPLFAPR